MQQRGSVDVKAIRERLEPVFRPQDAGDLEAVYQFAIDGCDAFHLILEGGRFEVGAGRHARPSLTFLFDDLTTALDVVTGEVAAMEAFMAGRIRTDGNLILALQLGRAFRR